MNKDNMTAAFPDWAIGPFEKYGGNPVLAPSESAWDNTHVSNPAMVLKDGRYYMVYRGEREKDIGICLASSDDGICFERYENNPVIRTNEFEDRPHDPRMWQYGDTYYVTYNAWCSPDYNSLAKSKGDVKWENRIVYQCLATSKDLIHWERHGVMGIKNGCIVTNPAGIPVKINNKFMLYGYCQGGFTGTSDNLINWEFETTTEFNRIPNILETCMVVTDISPERSGDIVVFTAVRPEKPALFALSECLFSKKDPGVLVSNLEKPILMPEAPFELEGYKGPGVPFHVLFMDTGLIRCENEWRLYYGGADHVICLAKANGR